jgi:hypothetical protein
LNGEWLEQRWEETLMELVISFQETELIRQLREQAEQLNVSLDTLVLDLIRLVVDLPIYLLHS